MFRVAIIGYRHQGSRHHAPAFARVPDCQIAAVCDIVEERAEQGAERYGVPAYTDVDEMLDREEIDIVDIPTGERFRYELVMKCLKRGLHVFTEKPLTATEGQYRIQLADVPIAQEMIDAWQRHDVQFGICFCLHASPNVQRVKEVIRSGELGRIRQIQARTALGSWNHVIDLVRFLGGEIQEVFGYADDYMMTNKAACLKFESGAVGTLAVSHNLSLQFQIKWIGDLGEATIDNIAGTASWRLHNSLDVTHWNETTRLQRSSFDTLFDDLIAEFVACIKEQRPFVADGWAGMRHIEIDAAITESITTGQPVRVRRYMPEQGHTILTMT
ncbi:MAG: Gfo/Idh/MocA family oxidoreductase [Candidatus Poribacteria bacterium]|nr:Gfo/Idh/MocA family oxidoreductase [Candidatus Poribacteria bacterium]